MALSHVNGLAAGSAPELGFCAQGRHVLCQDAWLTGVPLLPDLAAGVLARARPAGRA
jgi:hypothetical protein